MRVVTQKPPAMLMVASNIAAALSSVTAEDRRTGNLEHATD